MFNDTGKDNGKYLKFFLYIWEKSTEYKYIWFKLTHSIIKYPKILSVGVEIDYLRITPLRKRKY